MSLGTGKHAIGSGCGIGKLTGQLLPRSRPLCLSQWTDSGVKGRSTSLPVTLLGPRWITNAWMLAEGSHAMAGSLNPPPYPPPPESKAVGYCCFIVVMPAEGMVSAGFHRCTRGSASTVWCLQQPHTSPDKSEARELGRLSAATGKQIRIARI
ncbi:hypothetical protein INR49_011775 [Caranx melampygus]|nr:hypothetical protein INR49_011775 [Caranx melampygus]